MQPDPVADGENGVGGRTVRADARRNRRRILEAAEAVFAEQGASASTAVVAERAGVAIGTVFRHFPTKPDLLESVVMNHWERLVAEVDALVANPEAADALFELCVQVIQMSAKNGATFARLAETGARVHVGDALGQIRSSVELLLRRGQDRGVVRSDLTPDELIALLAALCQEAMAEGWSETFGSRVVTLLFDGLRPSAVTR